MSKKENDSQSPDLEKIKKIRLQSGNNFHCKVLNHLRREIKKDTGETRQPLDTLVSPYYLDGFTNKPRELDIVAYKGNYNYETNKQAVAMLFIECKFVTKPTVFWFDKIDRDKANALIEGSSFAKNGSDYNNRHHYLKTENVSKLFQSEKASGTDTDPIFKATNQCLNATVSLMGMHSTKLRNYSDRSQIVMNYPVVVVNNFDNFYRVNMDDEEKAEPQKIEDNFLLEVDYSYRDKSGTPVSKYFLVDIVSFEKLEDFIGDIQVDIYIATDPQ